MPKHIVIVGAGPGGLCAGMLLSHRGFKVTLFDKNQTVGGRNRPIKVDGFTFDTGPTFLLLKPVLDEMFALSGRRSSDYLDFIRLEHMYDLLYEDRRLPVYSDRQKMREALDRTFKEGSRAYDRFLDTERERFNKLFPCIKRDYSGLSSFLSWSLIKALPWLALPKSVIQNLGQYFQDEKLRLAFSFQSKYLGMSPWDCPALFTMLPYLEHDYGIYHVRGGLNRIAAAMATVIEENGGTIHTGTEIQSLLIEDHAVKGVRLLDGTEIRGDETIVNADFAHAMTHLILPDQLRKYSRQNIEKKDFSCSTFMLYLGLDKQYDLAHHSIVFARDYRTNIENIFNTRQLSADFSFYVHNPSLTDPELAPPGQSALYVLVPMPNNTGGIDWTQELAAVRESTLDAMASRLGLTDLRSHILCEKIITPADWESREYVFRGATFSLSHTFRQMLYWRPHNRFEELANCYLTGGGTHPGSGLPTIYESARISADLISKKYKVARSGIAQEVWLKQGREPG